MTTWFTADHHFGHEKIIQYARRPFASVAEMDTVLIDRWNEVVQPNDTVYHLGDLTLGNAKTAQAALACLNGYIKVLPGSHDDRWFSMLLDNHIFSASGHEVQPLEAIEELDFVTSGGKYYFTLCHYALRVWPRSHYGAYHLFGHSHGGLPGRGRSMDVGVDAHNFYPVSLEQVIERLEPRAFAPGEGELWQ